MPLDRQHVTPAAWKMLWLCIVFFAVVGANFMVAPTRLFQSPMLRYADSLMSIRIWGALFLACGVIMLVAKLAHNRYWYRYGLMVCFIAMMLWTGVAILGMFAEPVSFSAWVWPAFVGGVCRSMNVSLSRDGA